MKAAAIQLGAGKNKRNNIDNALKLIRQAIRNKARFIVLPEVYNYRGLLKTPAQRMAIAEHIPGESTRPLQELAGKHKVHILAGSIYERKARAQKVYNTSVLIDAQGRIKATYRKINLFDAVIGKKAVRESNTFLAGRSIKVADVGGFKTGLSICYDLRFSQLYKKYGKRKTDVICVPSAFTNKTGRAHWETLIRARAIENLSYVVAPNQIGIDERGIKYYGNSMIVGPWGNIVARATSNREQIIYGEIKAEEIRRVRKILPSV